MTHLHTSAAAGLLPRPLSIDDRDFLVVLARHDNQIYFCETTVENATEEQVVADIASGAIENAVAVLMLNVADNTSRDVSKEIARKVLGEHLDAYGEPQRRVIDFLEEHLGCLAVVQATREHAS